jgi:hypothetical protein
LDILATTAQPQQHPQHRKSLGGNATRRTATSAAGALPKLSSPFKPPQKKAPASIHDNTKDATAAPLPSPLQSLRHQARELRDRVAGLQAKLRGIESDTRLQDVDALIVKWKVACQRCVKDVAAIGRANVAAETLEFDSAAPVPEVTLKSVLDHFHIDPSMLEYDEVQDDFAVVLQERPAVEQ